MIILTSPRNDFDLSPPNVLLRELVAASGPICTNASHLLLLLLAGPGPFGWSAVGISCSIKIQHSGM